MNEVAVGGEGEWGVIRKLGKRTTRWKRPQEYTCANATIEITVCCLHGCVRQERHT